MPAQKDRKLTTVLSDFSDLERHTSHFSADDLFCCLGTTIRKAGSQQAFRTVDYDYPLQVARLARQQGTRQFLLVSALGANPDSKIFYNKVKGELEETVKQIDFRGIQIFRPSLLTGARQEYRFGEKVASLFLKIAAPVLRGGVRKYRPIAASTVARAMVEIAKTDLPGVNIFQSDQIQFFVDRLRRKK